MTVQTAPRALPRGRRLGAPSTLMAAAAVACTVLAYWVFERTPVVHTSARVHAGLTAGEWATAVAALLLAAGALLCALPLADASPAARAAARIRTLPDWAIVLPVSLAAAYVSARIAITPDRSADYWPALLLWLAAPVALAIAVAPPRAISMPAVRIRRPSLAAALRSELLLVSALTAIALTMRLVALSTLPPLVHVDEEAIGLDAWRAANGHLTNFFSVGWGANPALGFFIIGGFIKLFGADIMSVRIANAFFGAAAIPVVYLLIREMFDRPRAVVGTVFLVGYHLHLHFSRVGLNVVWDTPVMAAAMLFAYRASRDGRRMDFAAAGLICGFALYLYHGTRVVPIVVFTYFTYVAAFRWRFAREHWPGLSLAAGAFAVVALPLIVFYLAYQVQFWSRIDAASIFQSGYLDAQRDLGRSTAAVMWDQMRHAFGGWVYYGDRSPFQIFDTETPLVRGLAVIPLIAGIAYTALHLDDRRYALIAIGFVLPTFIGGALTLSPPNAQRLFSAVPSVICLISVGIWQLGQLVLARRRPLLAAAAVAVAAALASTDAVAYYRAAHDNTKWGAMAPSVAASYIHSLPEGTRVYWFGSPTITAQLSGLTLLHRTPIDMLGTPPAALAAPAAPSPSAYIFLTGQDARLGDVMAACPGGDLRDVSFEGYHILRSYEIAYPNTCVPPSGPPDTFASAVQVGTVPTQDFAVITDATREAGEPEPSCSTSAATIWYAYTAPTSGAIAVTTDGSALPTVVAVYTGGRLDALTEVACAAADGSRAARIQLQVEAGQTYFFQVGASDGVPAPGLVRLSLGLLAPG